MIRTIKDLREAIKDLDDDDFIYATDRQGNALDIWYVDDTTSFGFWTLKLSDTCEFFPHQRIVKGKGENKEKEI